MTTVRVIQGNSTTKIKKVQTVEVSKNGELNVEYELTTHGKPEIHTFDPLLWDEIRIKK